MNHCDNCGAPLRQGARFCNQCGQAVPPPQSSVSGQPAGLTPPHLPPAPPASGGPSGIPPTVTLPPGTAQPQAPVAPPAGAAPPTQALNDLLHDRYLVVRKLGEGGMGAAYLAEDTVLYGKLCVIKELLPYYTNEQEKQEAEHFFLREVKLLANLKHQGIPQVFDHFIISDHYYYVMEYVEGETLGARAARLGGRLPESEVLDYARQIADVLAYISSRPEPVIHRDIKPENLILDQATGQVKLVDFGLAKASLGAPVAGEKSSALGTPGYAPPEQYQGKAEPRSDVYSLGATLHHLLTGVDPRNASAPFQFAPVRSILPGVSTQTEMLLARMLDIAITNRPTAEQLKGFLATGNLPQAVVPRPPGVVYTPGLPFTFRSGASVRDVDELAQNCERFWDDAVYHLYQGHFDPWLVAQSRADLAQASQAIRGRMTDRDAGLEEFLRVLKPTLGLPVLQVNPNGLDFGKVERGSRQTLTLNVTNGGRGYLYGAIRPLVPWVRVRPSRVGCRAKGRQEISVDLDATSLSAGFVREAVLEIQTNGGSVTISAQTDVSWEPKLKLSTTRLSLGEVHVQQQGQMLTGELTLQNSGGGVLQGQLSSSEPWLNIASGSQFSLDSGQSLVVQIVADSAAIPALSAVEGLITVHTAGEVVPVSVRMGVKKEIYDLLPRALRWGAYISLVFLSALAVAYPLAHLPGWALAGRLPTMPLPSSWIVTPQNLANELLTSVGLQELARYVPVGLSMAYLLVVAVLGVIPASFARRFITELDEIESYHTPDLFMQISQGDVNRRFALRVQVVAGLAGFVIAMFNRNVPFQLDSGVRLVFAFGVGLLLGFVMRPGAGQPAAWQRLLAALGMVFFGAAVSKGSVSISNLAGWGILGLVLVPDLHTRMPVGWRWFLANSRRALYVSLLAFLAVSLGQMLTDRVVIPFYLVYGSASATSPEAFLKTLFSVVLGLAGAYAGLLSERDPKTSLNRPPKVFWIQLIVSGLAGLLVYILLRIPIGGHWSVWTRAFLFLVTLIGSGYMAWLASSRKVEMEQRLLEFTRLLANKSTKLSLPGVVDRWRQKTGNFLARLLGPAPLDGLSATIGFCATGIAVLLIPYVANLLFSSLRLVACLAGLLIPVAILAAFIYFVTRQTKS